MEENQQGHNRVSRFIDRAKQDLMVSQARSYLDRYTGHRVVLYRINALTTKRHDLYGESMPSQKQFFAPVELSVQLALGRAARTNRAGTQLGKSDFENFTFTVFEAELLEKDVQISPGDYVVYFDGRSDRTFEVADADLVNTSSGRLFGGYEPYQRNITARQVKSDVVLPPHPFH